MPDRLEKFEELSERFQSLIPLNGKKPVEDEWTYYFENTRLFDAKDFKGRNAGIPTGPANGALVLDTDDEKLFECSRKKNGWDLPETRTHLTGRGLPHYIYAYPKNGSRYGNRAFKKMGFDIRGIGGQVVAPGSIHPDTGRAYTILKDIPMAPAPEWLLELALQEPEKQLAQQQPTPEAVAAAAIDIKSLKISFAIKHLIDAEIPKGERSQAVASVLAALVKANVPDVNIIQIFNTHKIGEKYREKGRSKKRWLQDEIIRTNKFVNSEKKPDQKLKIPFEEFEKCILDAQSFSKLDIPERQELLFPWLKEDSINLISGWRGCGKTWFALSLLDAVTRGTAFGLWECKKSVPCLFLDGEMTISDDQERIQNLKLHEDRESPFYIYSDAYANRLGLPKADLTNEKWRPLMTKLLTRRKIKLWVVDNISSLATGIDENEKHAWDDINGWLLALRFSGISTILLHHTGKGGSQRGTSGREDNVDISIILKAPPNYNAEDGARFVVKFTKSRIRTSRLHLIGDTEFKLIEGKDGGYIWTCGNVRANNKNEVLKLLDEGLPQADVASTLGIGKAAVSKIRTRAMKDGLLTAKNKLTQSGFLAVTE